MCGIVGILSYRSSDLISSCNQMISHRGPDGAGVYVYKNLALGHNRLSIQDLSESANQPMHSDDGNYTIIFNGEIYNHHEIRSSLRNKINFKTTSDTETLLYAYIENGQKIFNRLNGIFAFAIINKRSGDLIIVRDQFGVKPLYYCINGNELFFGSEIKAFLKISGWNRELDYSALFNYLQLLYSTGEQTPFQNIKKLKPGHFLKCNIYSENLNVKFNKYYELPFDGTRHSLNEKDQISLLDSKFSKAVGRQLLSDVPVGFFLSGGVDSSLVVAKAREYSESKLNCFTIGTNSNDSRNEGFSDDLFYAKKVAKFLDVNLEIIPTDIDILNDFDKMVWHLDEPQADAAPLNVLNICNRAKDLGFKVLLGGTAGDDLFSGYRRHQALYYEKYFNILPSFAAPFIKGLSGALPASSATLRRVKKLFQDIEKPQIERILSYYEWIPSDAIFSLFSKDIQGSLNTYEPISILENSLKNIALDEDLLNKMLYLELKYFLPDHNLNYTDKMSMATGVEVRVPFLDYELVEMSTKIPVEFKMKNSNPKYILKKLAEKYLPKDIIYRSKTGFGAPVRKWIVEDLDEMVQDRLSQKNVSFYEIFDYKAVKKIIADNKAGCIDASYSILSLLAIDSWLRQFNNQS